MGTRSKRRMIIAAGVVVIVVVLILSVVSTTSAAKTVTLADAAAEKYLNQRVQVTGNVLSDSYSISDNILTFSLYDTQDKNTLLKVSYDGAASSTFGNDVVAICTGKIASDGVLYASEMITKCPSKYESGTDALELQELLDYGEKIYDTTVRVKGKIVPGSAADASSELRFVLADSSDASLTCGVEYGGALSEQTLADNASVVLTGSLAKTGHFKASSVALSSD